MDDLIYGLLVVAWVAYGIFSAVKKNKAKGGSLPSSTQAKPRPKDTVETLFESLFQVSSPNPLATSHPYSQSGYAEDRTNYEEEDYVENDYLDVLPEPSIESKIDTYSGTDNVQQAITIEEEGEEYDEIKKSEIEYSHSAWNEDSSLTFDLRQAVIAQAILERPYE